MRWKVQPSRSRMAWRLPVGFPPVGAVVGVSVEFDGQAAAPALDHEVDAEAADPVLGFDAVSAGDDVAVDVALEVGVEAVLCLGWSRRRPVPGSGSSG